MRAATLSIFQHLFASIAEEMGIVLGRTAYSPNIKERLDYSCAIFLGDGRLLAQAAHIPVHLGAMPASVQTAIERCSPFEPGDTIIVNDPYLGGTHLPDITIVSPIFSKAGNLKPDFFVASRAHHADIGGISPGSMPISREVFQEGLIIPPIRLIHAGQRNEEVWQLLLRNVRMPLETEGDLAAQLAANETGLRRIGELLSRYGLKTCLDHALGLISYARNMTRAAISMIPDGRYEFFDHMDSDNISSNQYKIQVEIMVNDQEMVVDFACTSEAVPGNLNAVPSIVESAVVYCLRCVALRLLGINLPMNQGVFEPLNVKTVLGSFLNPKPPHAVAAGNVETSQRIVDVVFGALSQALPEIIPAASQGTMNNVTFGSRIIDSTYRTSKHSEAISQGKTAVTAKNYAYYETIGGGIGAGPDLDGGDGMHAHMSNTRNTPVEALEYDYPVQVVEYRLRDGSGGEGRHKGGNGLVRTMEFLAPINLTVVSDRRNHPPYGLNGGKPGLVGKNSIIRRGDLETLPGKFSVDLESGDQICIETPGGGGWGNSQL